MLAFVVLGGFLFVITLYLQQVRGDTPLRAGLSLLPAMLVMAVAAPVAGQVTGRYGARVPLVASGLLIAAGMAMLLGLGPGTSFAWVVAALAVTGAGLGLVNPPITNTGVSGMPPAQAGVASAVISATRQFGSVLSAGLARGQAQLIRLPQCRAAEVTMEADHAFGCHLSCSMVSAGTVARGLRREYGPCAGRGLPQAAGELLPGAGGEGQGAAVAVGGVADQDRAIASGGFYAGSSVAF